MATKVEMKVLTQYLERFGWKQYRPENEPGEKEGIIYTGWRSSPTSRGFDLTIDPIAESNCLALRVYWLAKAPLDGTPPDRLADLMLLLAWLNHRFLIGKFAYDLRDGEVRYSVDLPIDENEVNYPQFEHTLRVITNTVEGWTPRLQALLNGEKRLGDIILQDARDGNLPQEVQKALEEVLKKQGKVSGGGEPLTEV